MSTITEILTVVKIGGSTLGANDTTLTDILELSDTQRKFVIVHGGGALITEMLSRLEIDTEFIEGLRSTPKEAIDVVIAVLCGIVNTQLVTTINDLGGRAVGVTGADTNLFQAKQLREELHFVGTVSKVNPELVINLIENDYLPVVAPVGVSIGAHWNINADSAAAALARAIGADELVFMTDVDGVSDKNGNLLTDITESQIRDLQETKVLTGGMIPKIEACLDAAADGIDTRIANGTIQGCLVEALSGNIGTRIS